MSNRFRSFLLTLALLGASASAFAAPGDLEAVERHCGPPNAESNGTSEVTYQLERTLIYNNGLYLNFQPVAGGWSFTSAWKGNLPITRGQVGARLSCFRDAMQDAATAAQATTEIDPTIAGQTIHPIDASFGIPHLWLIVALVITLLLFLILPSARQRKLARQQSKPIERIYRMPNLDEYIPPSHQLGNGDFD